MALATLAPLHSPTRCMGAHIECSSVPVPIGSDAEALSRATLTLSRTANRPPDASDGDASFLLAVVMYSVPKFCTIKHTNDSGSVF